MTRERLPGAEGAPGRRGCGAPRGGLARCCECARLKVSCTAPAATSALRAMQRAILFLRLPDDQEGKRAPFIRLCRAVLRALRGGLAGVLRCAEARLASLCPSPGRRRQAPLYRMLWDNRQPDRQGGLCARAWRPGNA